MMREMGLRYIYDEFCIGTYKTISYSEPHYTTMYKTFFSGTACNHEQLSHKVNEPIIYFQDSEQIEYAGAKDKVHMIHVYRLPFK